MGGIPVKIETQDLRSRTKVGLFERRVDASGELSDGKNISRIRVENGRRESDLQSRRGEGNESEGIYQIRRQV